MATEKILIDVEFTEKELTDKLVSLEEQILETTNAKKKLSEEYKKGTISQADYAKQSVDLTLELKALKKEQSDTSKSLQELTNLQNASENSYEALVAQYNLGQKALKSLENTLQVNADGTIELTEEYKKQQAVLENLKGAIIEFDLGIKNGKTNVGLYGDAIKEANEELKAYLKEQEKIKEENKKAQDSFKEYSGSFSVFGVSIDQAKESFSNFSKTLLTNPLLLIVAGIVLLAKTLQELFEKFKETEQGAGAVGEVVAKLGVIFNAIFSAVKPIFNFLINSFGKVLDVVTSVIDTAKGFFGISSNLEDSAKKASQLEKELLGVTKAQRALTEENAKNKKEQEALKNIRDDESKSLEARIEANNKLGKLELERVNKTLALEKTKLRILEDKLALEGEENASQEQLNELAEQRAKVYEAEEESLGRQNEQITNRVALEKEIFELRSSIKDLELEQEILLGKVREGSREELDRRNELVREKLNQELKQYQDNAEKQREVRLRYENEILKNTKDFNDKQAEQIKEAGEKQKQQNEENEKARVEFQKMALENQLLETTKGTEEEYQARLKILEFNYNQERALLVKNKQDTTELDLKFNLERDKMEQDFTNQQLVKNAEYLLKKKQQEIESLDLTNAEKLEKQRELLALQTELDLLKVADDDKREEERRLILEERKIKEKEIELEEYNLSLEEKQARIEFELENEGITLERRLALEIEYEQNRRSQLLAQRGLTQEQIEMITSKSEKKITDLKRKSDLEKIESENKLAQAQLQIANGVFDGLQLLAGKNADLTKAIFFLRKGFAIAEVIQNGIVEVARISSGPLASGLPATAPLIAAQITAAKIRTGIGVGTLIAQTIAEGSAPQKAESGGLLVGPSHSQGGIRGTGSFSNIEVEGGEFIVNKKATQKNLGLLKSINSFESGGVIPEITTSRAIDQYTAENKIEIPKQYIAVTDINEASENFALIEDIGTLK
jgi:hypothetical protein